MTTFPLLENPFDTLQEVARGYTRPGASAGTRHATLELIRQVLIENQSLLEQSIARVEEITTLFDHIPKGYRVEADSLQGCVDFVARTSEWSMSLVANHDSLRRTLPDAADFTDVVSILDHCCRLRDALSAVCRHFESDHPGLAELAVSGPESDALAHFETVERAASARPLALVAGGLGAAVGFGFGGLLPAVLAGVALFAFVAVASEYSLSKVIR